MLAEQLEQIHRQNSKAHITKKEMENTNS